MSAPLSRQQLPEAIKNAKQGATLFVQSEVVKDLGYIAASRMRRPDIRFHVATESAHHDFGGTDLPAIDLRQVPGAVLAALAEVGGTVTIHDGIATLEDGTQVNLKLDSPEAEDAQSLDFCRREFDIHAEVNGISLEHEADWHPWWECWCAGITAYVNTYGES